MDRKRLTGARKERQFKLDRAQAIKDDLEKHEKRQKDVASREKDEERRRLEAAKAICAVPRKILVCGDVSGDLGKVCTTVEAQMAKVGSFNALLCVGAFMPPDDGFNDKLTAYLRGDKRIPTNVYFVDSSSALLQLAPGGRTLCENLHYLGGYGVRELQGLRVAFLSGRYDAAVYNTPDVDFVDGAFTSRAVSELRRVVAEDKYQRGIDVLLTCAWPADIDEKILEESTFPPEIPDSRPWREFCSPPIGELCLALEPRYHIFGTADLFYQRPPFQVPRRGHVCRCIGLGRVGSASKQRKWLHALQLSPMAFMDKTELKQVPLNATPCPFTGGLKRAASEHPDAPPAKRSATSESDGVELVEQTIAALMAGDADRYRNLAGKLQGGVVECGFAEEVEVKPVVKPVADPTVKKDKIANAANWGMQVSSTAAEPAVVPVAKEIQQEEEKDEDLSEEALARKAAAKEWLAKEPEKGFVRYTFDENGPVGIKLSRDVPPWILEVRDGTLAAKKAPRVPLGGVVVAVNGYDLSKKDCQQAIKGLAKRPVIIDVEWPTDQGLLPTVTRA